MSATALLEAPAPGSPTDPITAYQMERDALLSAKVPEGFVDPHVAEIEARAQGDVDPVQTDDVDPGYLDGPSEAELRAGAGDDESPSTLPGTGPQALPTDDEPAPDEVVIDTEPAPTPEPVKPPQYRIRPTDEIEKRAFDIRKGDPTLSLKECIARAEAETTPAVEKAPTITLPAPEELAAKKKELEREWRAAVKDLADDERIADIEKQIEEIGDQIPQAVQEREAVRSYEATQFQSVADQAVALYPDAAVEGSALFNRMEEIHATMEAAGDETIRSPKKALIIAQMAARELSIAPQTPGKAGAKPTQVQQPRAVVTPQRNRGTAPMTAPLAATSARTAAPGINPLQQQIRSINSPDSYEALMASLRRRR